MRIIFGLWRRLSFLQWAAALSTLVLTLGAIWEYEAKLKPLVRLCLRWLLLRSTPFERCTLRKLFWHSCAPLLVVLGIAGELIFETRAFIVDNQLTAASDVKRIRAENDATAALKRATEAEVLLQPRSLTEEQARNLKDGLGSLNGRDLMIGSHWLDSESARFAGQIKAALNSAGIGAKPGGPEDLIGKWPRVALGLFGGGEFHGTEIHSGIEVWGKDRKIVADALKHATGLTAVAPDTPGPFGFETDSLVSVFVGLKPLPQIEALEKTVNAIAQQPKALSAPVNELNVVNGAVTPDLSKGSVQRVLLTADIIVNAPRMPYSRSPVAVNWTFFVDSDKTGMHGVNFAPSYKMSFAVFPFSETRSSISFLTDQNGQTTVTSVAENLPIP
jgi:hypothetical protein